MANQFGPSLSSRFWSRVQRTDGCWLWTGGARNRYGAISINGRMNAAHRVSWELNVGPIPQGMHVLHRCDNPPCVNPAHLFIGDNAENARDRDAKGRHANRLKTVCKNGHPLTGSSLYVEPNGYRQCRACKHEWDLKHRPPISRGGER